MLTKNNLISISFELEAKAVAFIAEEDDEGAGVCFRDLKPEYTKALRPEESGGLV